MQITKRCKGCTKQIPKGLQAYCSYQCSDKLARKRAKDKKQKTPGYWMKKADTKASLYYRTQTPYCEAQPHYKHECKNGLQWCHVYSRKYKAIRYAEYNKLIMCGAAHMYFTYNPEEWFIFVQENFSDRWELATENRHNTINNNAEYYQSWFNKFNSV